MPAVAGGRSGRAGPAPARTRIGWRPVREYRSSTGIRARRACASRCGLIARSPDGGSWNARYGPGGCGRRLLDRPCSRRWHLLARHDEAPGESSLPGPSSRLRGKGSSPQARGRPPIIPQEWRIPETWCRGIEGRCPTRAVGRCCITCRRPPGGDGLHRQPTIPDLQRTPVLRLTGARRAREPCPRCDDYPRSAELSRALGTRHGEAPSAAERRRVRD